MPISDLLPLKFSLVFYHKAESSVHGDERITEFVAKQVRICSLMKPPSFSGLHYLMQSFHVLTMASYIICDIYAYGNYLSVACTVPNNHLRRPNWRHDLSTRTCTVICILITRCYALFRPVRHFAALLSLFTVPFMYFVGHRSQ